MLDPDNLRLPTSAELLVNLVEVVISFVMLIGPKSPEREPLVTAPTVVIEELPALSENLALASSSVKRSSNCVCIADDKPCTNSNSS